MLWVSYDHLEKYRCYISKYFGRFQEFLGIKIVQGFGAIAEIDQLDSQIKIMKMTQFLRYLNC